MSVKTTLAVAAFSIFAAGSAFASEYEDSRAYIGQSTKSRAEVVAEIKGAPQLYIGEMAVAPAPESTALRARVVAEAREALRLGLTASNEIGVPQPTVAQSEAIRVAGDRAAATVLAAAR